MRAFKGRYYYDMTGNVPSEQQLQQDLSPTEVQVQPRPEAQRADTWELREDKDSKTLVHIHHLPRLALFSPLRVQTCPVSMDELTGKRTTVVRPVQGGDEVRIHDNMEVVKTLQDRWTGETQFEMKMGPRPLKVRRSVPKTGLKRPPEKDLDELQKEQNEKDIFDDQEQPELPLQAGRDLPLQAGQDLPPGHAEEEVPGKEIPSSSLNDALLRYGSDAVDGLPVRLKGSAGSNECAIPGCELPGGHQGVHQGPEGKFLYDSYKGKKFVTEEAEAEDDDDDGIDAESTSSEELLPDSLHVAPADPSEPAPQETFFALELPVESEDYEWLANNCVNRKANVWLSRKMAEKSKEVQWKELTLDQKKLFDIAMAKELSQVATSRALRNITKDESLNLDKSRVMNMRWVLTWKGDGSAKARLVILGFQAHNLCEVETTSPTLSKVGRNLLLAVCAACGLKLGAGDVTSAFLQTDESLESEELYVWAPPELSSYFGGNPLDPRALRVLRAFYGLVHSPRKWWETVVSAMKQFGWKPLLGDKCLFVLTETVDGAERIAGVAGLHVDDFLIAGRPGSKVYEEAERALRAKFRFGKWSSASDGFEFAGTWIVQHDNFEITMDQKDYTLKFIEEIEVGAKRPHGADLTKNEISAIRGALGTASWRATQSAPQYLADTSLLLGEINKGKVALIHKVNKLIRDMKRNAQQKLIFPHWHGVSLDELAVISWADASNHNRSDKGSTIGVLTGLAPKGILQGQETQVAVIQWKSGRTPRQTLSSNGAEVQSITIAEDMNFQIRGLFYELCGHQLERKELHRQIASVPGAVVMDSKGIYDASTRNLSSLHGLRDSRAGYELTLAVIQAQKAGTLFRWVCGLAQLADTLTKYNDRKALLQFFAQKQFWKLVHDETFTAGRKVHKKALERKLREDQDFFVAAVKEMAEKSGWPWIEEDVQYHPFT